MSSSVSVSIFTNTAIAASKGFGWFVTGSPTLFAEMVHSFADVANQVLLRIGEVRGQRGPDREHPLGRGQEKFFWALVSAVSVFFVGCGLNVYHGFHALLGRATVEPFTALVLGLLVFAAALESYTLRVAVREIGGLRGVLRNRHRTTVLAVVLEDVVALLGILLTLLVAGVSFVWGPKPIFDAIVAILVGVLLGIMALFLAALNRRLLIDANDSELDREAAKFLAQRGIPADVTSIVVDDDSAVVFVRARGPVDSHAIGEALKAQVRDRSGKNVEQVYWQFPAKDA
ncbi:MAG TPA: cation transporter [Casimicrobiaceae bacterium]|nr:cation transporter [Casimicrobiaceae bacterium]